MSNTSTTISPVRDGERDGEASEQGRQESNVHGFNTVTWHWEHIGKLEAIMRRITTLTTQ